MQLTLILLFHSVKLNFLDKIAYLWNLIEILSHCQNRCQMIIFSIILISFNIFINAKYVNEGLMCQ